MATLLLNHFNGSDGATTFTDEVSGVSWAINFGTPKIDTAQAKFGASSLLLRETEQDSVFATLTTTVSNTSSYSIELFYRFNSEGSFRGVGIDAEPDADDGVYCSVYYDGGWRVILDVWNGSSSFILYDAALSTSYGAWHHLAVVRDAGAGTYALYHDGSRINAWSSASNLSGPIKYLYVGADEDATWVDDVRLTDEVPYSGATYTVPTSEFAINVILSPAADTISTSESVVLTTAIYLAATDTVTVSDAANLSTSTEFLLGEDVVTTIDSADLTTAIPLAATDTVVTSDTVTLTVPPAIILVPATGGASYQGGVNVGEVLKPAIPPTTDLPYEFLKVLDPIKENIETITGRRGGRIETLPADATLEQTVARLNLVISRLMS